MNEYELLNDTVRNKFEIQLDYILVHCKKCDSHWGVSLSNRPAQELSARDLICRNCAADEVAKRKG